MSPHRSSGTATGATEVLKRACQSVLHWPRFTPSAAPPSSRKGGAASPLNIPPAIEDADQSRSFLGSGLAVPALADFVVAVSNAEQHGDFDPAVLAASAVLAARAAAGDAFAQQIDRLLSLLSARAQMLPVLSDLPRVPVHFDDRVAHCFEQIVALIHTQSIQIAELQAIVAELT